MLRNVRPARKSRKTDKQLAMKLAKGAMSNYIRHRDNWTCFTCDRKFFGSDRVNQIDAGHFLPSTYAIWKFDERNVHAQCIGCNQYLGGNVKVYRQKMINLYGQELVNMLERMRYDYVQFTIIDLNRIQNEYTLKLANLLNEINV